MGVNPVVLIWQDPYFLATVNGRDTPRGKECGVGVIPFLVNSRWKPEQIRKHLEELTNDLVKLADAAGYPVPREDADLERMFWRAAAGSFVKTKAKDRIEKSTKTLTDTTKDPIGNRGPDIGVGLRLNEMAEVVYVLAGAIKLGYYSSVRSFEGSSLFHALPSGK